jgi:hypothetical protein
MDINQSRRTNYTFQLIKCFLEVPREPKQQLENKLFSEYVDGCGKGFIHYLGKDEIREELVHLEYP